ncbi:MAG TPA: metal-dependent hydrolase [Bdellovibrionota bacterium]|jgi:inner membrane protein|nr:metal-dependent hydrolase [Bdellovibrionota bacterium]
MDNLTHSLVGVVIHRACRRLVDPKWDRALFWTAVVGSNLPDADGLFVWVSGHVPLGYLLHHRGYTHTLLLTPLLAVISVGLGCLVTRSPWRPPKMPWKVLPLLLGIAWFCLLFHIGMDSWNSYGVHPFWPWKPDWRYGDTIFIVEPLILFALLPYALFSTTGRSARIGWGIALAAMEALVCFAGVLRLPVILVAQVWGVLNLAAQWKIKRHSARFAVALLGMAAVFGAYRGVRHQVLEEVRDELAQDAPQERVIEVMTGPGPVNPFCWSVMVSSVGPQGDWITRRGFFHWTPGWEGFSDCDRLAPEGTFTAGPVTVPIPPQGRLVWRGQYQWPLRELKALSSKDCGFEALLRFARFPAISIEKNPVQPGAILMGDLRFDRSKGLDFAEFEGGPHAPCPRMIPSWDSKTRRTILSGR